MLCAISQLLPNATCIQALEYLLLLRFGYFGVDIERRLNIFVSHNRLDQLHIIVALAKSSAKRMSCYMARKSRD